MAEQADPTGRPRLRAGSQPRYLMLADVLIEDIVAGTYPVDSLLPTEHELCRQFNLSRHTVREAMRRLTELGFVSRQAGVGPKVKSAQAQQRYTPSSHAISDLFQYVKEANLKVRDHQDVIADAELAALLDCREGQAWLNITGERHVVGETKALSVNSVYVARAYRGVLTHLGDGSEPIYTLIERLFGLRTIEVRQEIFAIALSLDQAGRLQVEPGTPGLRLVRRYFSETGEMFELAESLHAGDHFSYASTLRLDPGATT